MAEKDKPSPKPQRVFIGDSLNFPVFKVNTPVPSSTAAPKPETTASSAGAISAGERSGMGSKDK
jgi:hypothetical protein